MVIYREDNLLKSYLLAYSNVWDEKNQDDCDRCGALCTDLNRKLSIERWISIAPRGAKPFFCIDCARRYGLVW